MKTSHAVWSSAFFCIALGGCDEPPLAIGDTEFTLNVATSEYNMIPTAYTCDGEGISPSITWDGAPYQTQSFALLMDHAAPEGMHWYWTLYNIPAGTSHLEEGEMQGKLGSNSVNDKNQYAPPCSKGPGVKQYTFTLYALSASIDVPPTTSMDRDTLLNEIKNITIDSTSQTLTYERKGQEKGVKSESKHHLSGHPHREPTYPNITVESPRCSKIKQSIDQAGFEENVSVICDKDYAYIISSTYPEHEMMTGITSTNEQIPVPAADYVAPIKLNPSKADALTTIDAALGIAVNGVPLYDYSSQGDLDISHYDESHDTVALGQLDICGGHAGRGDDYHYHAAPTCMINAMKNQGSDAIIGWAYDGYPLYGDTNPDGSVIGHGELDVCNGQPDSAFGYRYHTSTRPPYIFQCLVGNVDTNNLPRVSPLNGDNQGIRADLRPPQNEVENLTHTISEDGSRTMRYTYQDEAYFTTYRPVDEGENCYEFKQKTISNGGKIEKGTFCRGSSPNSVASTVARVNKNPEINGTHHFKLEAWADNWFSAYIGEQLLIEDSIPITTERSFNAETVSFSADYPIELNVIIKDFKQNDTGLEYIGARNQQMGDGGFILQITDTDINQVVATTDRRFKCEVLHKAPLDKRCEDEDNPVAGKGYCKFTTTKAPESWLQGNFDYEDWPNAVEHDADSVGPKDGYNEIVWADNAKLIWSEDLESDNTLICKTSIQQPK